MNKKIIFAFLLLAGLISGCAHNFGGLTHYSVANGEIDKQVLNNVIVIPVDASAYELGIANLEKVPEWSERAQKVLQTQLDAMFDGEVQINSAAMPELNAEEKLTLDEHIAVYREVVKALRGQQAVSGWQHKKSRVDGTVGSGLQFLQEKTGSETALVVSGLDVKSSGGRMVAAGVAALMGVGIPMGHSEVIVGFVNLGSGDVLWSNHSFSTSHGLTTNQDARSMLQAAFSGHDKFLADLEEDR
ncbi:hypothetical protein [Microbulbifer sp. TYP-18]|uniref:hypothetical protein n=1 Tax=Microbulbifer sp. TYP-18 TaxID=3230024 RepID=UPI0034C5DA38